MNLHQILSSIPNLETGSKTVTKTNFVIKKAIGLPANTASLSLIGQLGINQGPVIDRVDKIVIIDKADLPRTFSPENDDYIVINHQRYEVKTHQTYDHFIVYAIRLLIGVETDEIHKKVAFSKLTIIDSASYTLN